MLTNVYKPGLIFEILRYLLKKFQKRNVLLLLWVNLKNIPIPKQHCELTSILIYIIKTIRILFSEHFMRISCNYFYMFSCKHQDHNFFEICRFRTMLYLNTRKWKNLKSRLCEKAKKNLKRASRLGFPPFSRKKNYFQNQPSSVFL